MFSDKCPICNRQLIKSHIYFYICPSQCYSISFTKTSFYLENVYCKPYIITRYYNGYIQITNCGDAKYCKNDNINIYSLNEKKIKILLMLM